MTDGKTMRAPAEAIGGDPVAGELRRRIAIERSRIAADVAGYHTEEPPRPGVPDPDHGYRGQPRELLQVLARRSRAVRDRAAALTALDPSEPIPSPREQAREIFDGLACGPRAGEACRYLGDQYAGAVARLTTRLAELERSIERIRGQAREGDIGDAPARLAECLEEQAEARRRLDALGHGAAGPASEAAAAVAAAGGLEHLAACVRAAWEVSGKWLQADPSYPLLAARREALAACQAKLSKVSDAESRLARCLRAERDAAAARVEATERDLSHRRAAAASSLVERSARADGGAIEELLAVVASCPHAFPADFGSAFDDLKPSAAQLVGTLEVLLTGEE